MRWQYTEGKLMITIHGKKHEFLIDELEERKQELIDLLNSNKKN